MLSGWTFGGILRYSSGKPIRVPQGQNSLNSILFRSGVNASRVPGQPLFTKDLDCGCIDPNKDFVLNPNAWTDPPAGQFGTAANYYNDYRYARRPDEQLSLGKEFRITESKRLQIRAEFFNVFNRVALNNRTARMPWRSRLPAPAVFRPRDLAESVRAASSPTARRVPVRSWRGSSFREEP